MTKIPNPKSSSLDMLELEQVDDGVLLPVHAQPGARKNAIVGLHAGRLKVAVTQAPEKGKANITLVKVLAGALGLKRSQLSLRSGPTSSRKTFLVTGIEPDDLGQRIAACLE